ncbi:MAG: transglycosylase domain-containing protein [Candidatus Nealsonbacteria bacterium]|nr:transglycosylase domain-containing protein [Candidatus Nealsonbacteria bacterium]
MFKKYYKNIYKSSGSGKSSTKNIFKKLFQWFLLALLMGSVFSLAVFVYFAKDLPRPENFTERRFIEPTRIYDRTGQVILYTIFGEEKRDLVSIDQIPEHLQHAVIVTEDANFYSHIGVDFRGIARSFLENIRLRRVAQGGSTISQQLIRSTFLTGERTLERKVREVILTIELERRYSKEMILEFYLNQIPFGGNAYGVEAASQTFFNKSVSEITVPEAAILAALIRSPGRLSPYGNNIDALMIRKNYVIDRMVYKGYLSYEEGQEFKEEEIVFSPINRLLKAPHFTLEVVSYLMEKYGDEYLRTRGLKVYTTLDWNLQKKAEEIVKRRVALNTSFNSHNSSLVALNPNSGEILAMVGSANYFKDPYPAGCTPGENCLFEPYPNVTKRSRQPGSAFKPIVYASVFKNGHNDQTIIVDEPINIAGYAPRNYDGLFRGAVTIRQALAQSLNIPAVRATHRLTNVEEVLQTAGDLGITTLVHPASFYRLPLALGTGEVTLLELTSAYGVFAADGFHVPPTSIIKMTDSRGRTIEKRNVTPRRVLNSNVARSITSILSDNEARSPVFGSNSLLNIPGISVKTGTTQDYRDGWAIGYNNSIAVGVWSGNNDNTPMRNAPGAGIAVPIWKEFIEYATSF